MYYYKARIYSPTLGRFLQTVPIGYKDQINLYAYVGDDPLKRSDPTGLYNCEKDQCQQIEGYVKQIREAARSPDTGTRIPNGTLTALVKAIGTMNDGNKINISVGNTKSALEAGVTSLSNGHANILLSKSIGKNYAYGAIVLGHETVHAAQFLTRGEPTSLHDVDQRERAAYTVQSKISEKLGVASRVWWPGITARERWSAIRAGAYDSCESVAIGEPPLWNEPFPGQTCP